MRLISSLDRQFWEILKKKPLMNQISPRVFEAIANKTALLMFKGEYSGILKKDWHYISLEKDFSNLEECLERVKDKAYLQRMVDRAFDDIISSNKYHERGFFRDFYKVLEKRQIEMLQMFPKKGCYGVCLGLQPRQLCRSVQPTSRGLGGLEIVARVFKAQNTSGGAFSLVLVVVNSKQMIAGICFHWNLSHDRPSKPC